MDVRQRIVDEFMKKLAESPDVGDPLREELARLLSGTSVSERALLDLFQRVTDDEN